MGREMEGAGCMGHLLSLIRYESNCSFDAKVRTLEEMGNG